ncbi:MAG: L,D-transpeptidase [Myxococcota bacterium]|nr:L,D-transpeptidase [Myxococcota bacterium]
MKHPFFRLFPIAILAIAGCKTRPDAEKEAQKRQAAQQADKKTTELVDSDAEPPPPPPEGRPVVVYENGVETQMTEPQATAKGVYTVIDLSNFWVPFIFSEQDGEDGERLRNDFRPIFRKLANDWPYESRTMAAARATVDKRIAWALDAKIRELRDAGVSEEDIRERLGIEPPPEVATDGDGGPATPTGEDPEEAFEGGLGDVDNFLEVYGIPPSLSVLRKRALQEVNRPCFNDIDLEKIKRFDGFVSYKNNDVANSESLKGRTFARKMRREMERLNVTDPLELTNNLDAKVSRGLVDIALRYEAIVEVQKFLVCAGFYRKGAETTYRKGAIDWKTHQALVAFEHKHRIFGWGFIGRKTLEALRKSPQERLFDGFLRVLAERIADATGIIEDGSAKGPDGKPAAYKDLEGQDHPVPNLVAEYTAAVIRHMDLGTPDKVIGFLTRHDDGFFNKLFVAVPLPTKPPYYSDVMDLHAELERGDVWYEYPFNEDGSRRGQPRKNMPKLTLYVKWNGQDIPLATMGTTIGGWRSERAPDNYEYYKYKNSDVGPRVWKDIVAGPVWLPPGTTPVDDLVKTVVYRGRKISVPNYDEFGPWYASAYGLVAAFHVRPVERKSGNIDYFDNGIRTHGSVDYNSILRRFSHGCHRLYNHLAIRLFDFVLRHKKYTRIGQVPAGYSHQFTTSEDETHTIVLDSKGYRYELTDPLPINVLTGRVRGKQRVPIEHHMPKPGVEYGLDAQFLPEGYQRPPTADGGTPEN